MSLRICEKIRLQKVLSDLDQECEIPSKFFDDNKVVISIANNPVQHDRTKHVEIDWHFIKERLDSGSICIPYIPLSQQVANVLTKRLLRPNFNFRVSKLGRYLRPNLRGNVRILEYLWKDYGNIFLNS